MFIRSINSIRSFATRPALAKLANSEKIKSNPFITCKRKEFNLSLNEIKYKSEKFGKVTLASDGWRHNKSKGDFFTIHPTTNTKNGQSHETAKNFKNLEVNQSIIEVLEETYGINAPTYIQGESIPKLLDGNHALIAAETGCGKTLSYLIPVIQQIIKEKQKLNKRDFNTPLGLILLPGRELASQIGNIAEDLGKHFNLKVKTILGGRTKQLMLNPSFEDVDLLVGTIGAISKLTTTGIYRMNNIQHVVLDEADTLLDDSFNEKLAYFLKRFPFHRNHLRDDNIIGTQLILASATMPTNTTNLLEQIIDPSTMVEIASPNLHKLLTHVPQKFLRMNKSDRPGHLLTLVKSEMKKNNPVIVFGNRSVTSDFINLFLNDKGVPSVNLNGDMLMKIRVNQFEKFQSGSVNVLATTDVGSRGLDTTRARHIINFDFPLHISDYIHRCGRTGRVGSSNDCTITNFISSQREIDVVQKIEHASRTNMILPDVNANITNIIKGKILKDIDDDFNDDGLK